VAHAIFEEALRAVPILGHPARSVETLSGLYLRRTKP